MKKRVAMFLALLICLTAVPAMAANMLKFDKTVTTLFEGETLQTALIMEGDPATGTVTYSSNATHNAVVDDSGLVTGVSKGPATITAVVKTEKTTFKANIQLNVLRKVTEVNVNEDKLQIFSPTDPAIVGLLSDPASLPDDAKVLVLRMGRNQSIQASLQPKDANNRKFALVSSDESVVRVSSNNLIPKSVGECTVSAYSVQNPEVMATYHVLVVQPVTKLRVTAPEKSMFVGQTMQAAVTYTPENASIKAVEWTSSNTKVATVDANGIITALAKGTATIRAKATDGSNQYNNYSLTVKQQATNITLNESDFIVFMGSAKNLKATVEPKNTNNKKVVWSSSDESVAKVNQSGRVTPISVGTCVITAASQDHPGVAASATARVHQKVTKIQFAEKQVEFHVGTSMQVFWEVSPANATDPTVTFSTNKPEIATVDENGLITGHKRGECYITATAVDGSKKNARIKVIIQQPVEGVHMKNDTLNVGVNERITATAVMEPENATNTNMTWYSADTSIATVKGSKNRPTITGQRWGTTTITGVTEDGGYSTSATINVGNYDKALKITDLYLQDNEIKIVVNNESNMNIARFYYTICCYDLYDEPIVCNENGGTSFDGSYRYTLYEGDNTGHGKFSFGSYIQPQTQIARVTMQITSYSTEDGYYRDIREDRQTIVEYTTHDFVGKPEPTEVPAAEPAV